MSNTAIPPDPSTDRIKSSTRKLDDIITMPTELANKTDKDLPNAKDETKTAEGKREAMLMRVKDKINAIKKMQEVEIRVENSICGRIGKKDLEAKGELYERVYAEEMEREMERWRD